MKTAAIVISAFAALAAAQDISSLPQCGQQCATNMTTIKGKELECENNEIECLCKNPGFIYGFRDCSFETCKDDVQAQRRVVDFGVQLCKNAGIEIKEPEGSGSMTVTASTATDEDGNGGGAGGMVSTWTSDGSIMVTTMTPDETVTSGTVTSTVATDEETVTSGTTTVPTGTDTDTMEPTSSERPTQTNGGSGGDDNSDDNNDDSNNDGGNDEGGNEGGDDEDAAIRAAPAGILAAIGVAALML